MTAQPRPPWDPDPRYEAPVEPVTPYFDPEDDDAPMIIVWLAAALLAIVVWLAIVALVVVAARPATSEVFAPTHLGSVSSASLVPGAPHGEAIPGTPGIESATTPDPAHQAVVGAPRYSGTATWYCSDGRGESPVSACPAGYGPDDLVAAIDRKDSEFRKGDRITVRFGERSVTVTIVDTCKCVDARVIDLTIGAFERLAPWGLGVLPVTIEAAGPGPTLPPTDGAP